MRLLACAAVSLTVALAGCAGDAAEHTWDGPPDPGPGGTVAVEGFVAHQDAVDEHWEGSATMAAAEFLRLYLRAATQTSIDGSAGPEGGPETVVVTLDGLLDDSVRAERWTLRFEPDGETFTLTSAQWSQRCQPGRGHQGFAAAPCL